MLSFFRANLHSIFWLVLAFYVILLVGIVLVADLGLGEHAAGAGFFCMLQAIPAGDKLGHFLLFGMLAYLVNLAGTRSRTALIFHLKITAGVAALVVVEEFSQMFLPHRNFDVMDLAADLAGIILFSSFAYLQKRGSLAA